MNIKILLTVFGLVITFYSNMLFAKDMPQQLFTRAPLGIAENGGQTVPTGLNNSNQNTENQLIRNVNWLKNSSKKVVTKVQEVRHIIRTQKDASKKHGFRSILLYAIIAAGVVCLIFAIAGLKNLLAIPIVVLGILLAIYILQLLLALK